MSNEREYVAGTVPQDADFHRVDCVKEEPWVLEYLFQREGWRKSRLDSTRTDDIPGQPPFVRRRDRGARRDWMVAANIITSNRIWNFRWRNTETGEIETLDTYRPRKGNFTENLIRPEVRELLKERGPLISTLEGQTLSENAKSIVSGLPKDISDRVNHPPHYKSHPSGIECIQITEHMSFCVGNAMKYLWRADEKGSPIEDLEKAKWYIQREIDRRRK